MSTIYHAKYFANELTKESKTGIEKLSRSFFDASVDLNPHQIEAILFAFDSPLSKGLFTSLDAPISKLGIPPYLKEV